MNHFAEYIFMLLIIVVGIFIVKKVTSCLFKIIIAVVFVAILAWLYLSSNYQTSLNRI